jgi:hypothetical protein
MQLYLKLFHGRNSPDELMNDWGFSGPSIPIECFGFTYDTLWFIPEGKDERVELTLFSDCIEYNGSYYGDFNVFNMVIDGGRLE